MYFEPCNFAMKNIKFISHLKKTEGRTRMRPNFLALQKKTKKIVNLTTRHAYGIAVGQW